MNNNCVFTKNKLKFSLKNATKEFSLVRVRLTINGVRISYCLPVEYKIKSSFWDNETGTAIEDPKKNPALKGNPILQTNLRNINKEIEKTTNALLGILENYRLRDIQPMADQIKSDLQKELKGASMKGERVFNDFDSFIEYYVTLCREGVILNRNGTKLATGTIKNYLATQRILKHYSASRHVRLRLESITSNFYNDFIKYLNETQHAKGSYAPNGIGKFIKTIKIFMRYAYENSYSTNDEFRKRDFRVYREDVESIYLTEEELDALYRLELPEGQGNVRDSFLISCYTGLRYSDISRLEPKHINYETNTISIVTQKTNTQVVIPMRSILKEIFKKHGNKPPVVFSNQATNRELKKKFANWQKSIRQFLS